MDRIEIHQQIRELSDKINHLNENLFNSRKIHPVELDLIRLYVRELTAMTDQLVIAASNPILNAKEELHNDKPLIQPAKPVVKLATEHPPAPPTSVNSGFAITLAEEQTTAIEPTIEQHTPATYIVKESQPEDNEIFEKENDAKPGTLFSSDEQRTSPLPRRQVTIQQQERPAESETTLKKEPVAVTPKPANPVIHLSMEEEEKDAPSINDLFAQQDKSSHYNKAKRADIKGFKESMDLGERYLFLKELFNGNQASFDEITEIISNVENMEAARKIIEEKVQPQYDWTGKDLVVKQFYTLLEQRFL